MRLAVEQSLTDLTSRFASACRIKEIFKSIGCTVDRPTAADRERLGMNGQEAKATTAILQAPPVFPKAKKGGPAKR